jgi:hypothetical protein
VRVTIERGLLNNAETNRLKIKPPSGSDADGIPDATTTAAINDATTSTTTTTAAAAINDAGTH